MHLEMFMNWGSLAWMITLIVAGIFFCKGLYVGLVPAVIDLAGLLLGIIIGLVVGGLASLILGGFLPWPRFFTGMAVGFVVAIGIFTLVSYCAVYIYEFLDEVLTDFLIDPSETSTRIAVSIAGGFVEFFVGMILMWGGFAILVACGNVAEAQIQKSNLPPNWAQETLVKTKDLIKGASTEELAQVTERICQPIAKLVKISKSPQAMARTQKYPDVQALMLDPKIAALLASPDVNNDVAEGDYTTMVRNPLLLKVATDFSLVRQLSSNDLDRELNEILGVPASAPTTSAQ